MMDNEIIKVTVYSVIIFLLLMILARLIGKKLLPQMTFFDFVVGITLGTIAGSFVSNEIKGYYVLVSPVILTVLVLLTGYFTLKSVPFRKLIEGEPVIVIQNGRVLENNMKKMRYHLGDLMMQLREKNIFNMSEVEFAVLEPHGRLSVLKKSQHLALTPKDMNLATNYQGLSSDIIQDGQIVEKNLRQNNLNHQWLFAELEKRNIKDIQDVFLAQLSTDGSLYIDLRQK